MDDYADNPAFRDYSVPTPYEPRSQTPSPRKPPSANVPAAIRRIILDLSLRFQPTDEQKRAAFNDRVALLAADCANVPPSLLDQAAKRWIASGDGFLPTASALIKLAQQAQSEGIERSAGTRDWYRIYLEKAVLRNAELASSPDPQLRNHRWIAKRGGGMEIMSAQAYRDEEARARKMHAEGSDKYDGRFFDMAQMAREIAQRGAA